jgi:hypothetical protein
MGVAARVEQTRNADVIDFVWESQERLTQRPPNPVAELALNKCEEMLQGRDWDGFGYWHAIYHRERAKAPIHPNP